MKYSRQSPSRPLGEPMESWTWLLPIVQGISFSLTRWAGGSLFYPPPAPIFMGRMWLAQLLFVQGTMVAIVVVILGFTYANHPWWLLFAVIITGLWAHPPYRGRGPMTSPRRRYSRRRY